MISPPSSAYALDSSRPLPLVTFAERLNLSKSELLDQVAKSKSKRLTFPEYRAF